MKFFFLFIFFSFSSFTLAAPPVDNFHHVSASIYRGARPVNDFQVSNLEKFGIKTVINLQGGDLNDDEFGWIIPILEAGELPSERKAEQESVENHNMIFLNYALSSLETVSQRDADKIVEALIAMSTPELQPVFVHCAHGADRTGLVVALYRVLFEGWDIEQAHTEMIKNGHNFLHQIVTSHMDEFLLNPLAVNYVRNEIKKRRPH